MTATLTPAMELVEKLSAVAAHLKKNPHLSSVDIDARAVYFDFTMHIAVYPHQGETGGVKALLEWAKSFDKPTITVEWHDEEKRIVTVAVNTMLGGYTVSVWDIEGGDLYRWRTGGKFHKTPITLEQLAEYVAAGTVEGLGTR
jgi:hypothetical protein